MLAKRWWCTVGQDWITTVSSLDHGTAGYVVGSRSGILYVVDTHGTICGHEELGSWVGATAIYSIDASTFVVTGTKDGRVSILGVESVGDQIGLRRLKGLAGSNTIRSIDVSRAIPSSGRAMVAVASEDRSVYVFTADDYRVANLSPDLRKFTFNGWIRAAVFCFTDTSPMVAAGCGDKSIYFIVDPGSQTSDIRSIHCGGKVHALLATSDGKRLYATTDQRELIQVNFVRRTNSFHLQEPIALPFRATQLDFLDSVESHVLIASERGQSVIFDTGRRALLGGPSLDSPLLCLESLHQSHNGGLVTGHDHGRLKLSGITLDTTEPITTPITPLLAKMVENDTNSPEDDDNRGGRVKMALRGHSVAKAPVGIGRFLACMPSTGFLGQNAPEEMTIALSTDDGSVVLLHQEATNLTEVDRYSFQQNVRAWSVAFQPVGAALRLLVGTSEAVVTVLTWDGRKVEHLRDIVCPDWPRELRAVRNGGETIVFAGCESGDVLKIDEQMNASVVASGAGRIRSLCLIDNGSIAVGTDDMTLTFIADGAAVWTTTTQDRVREVAQLGQVVIAVSEDHYVYAVDLDGVVQWRLQLPHRVLCVEALSSDLGTVVVVGCGDGIVYFMNDSGTLLAGAEFPDRIRDIISTHDGALTVACEDGFLYLLETQPSGLPAPLSAEDFRELSQGLVETLRINGIDGVSEYDLETSLTLLLRYEEWQSADSDAVLACMDQAMASVVGDKNVALYYSLASAITEFSAEAGQLAACRARISRLMELTPDNGPYPAHAALRSIAEARAGVQTHALIDLAVGFPRLEKESWLSWELCRLLRDSRYFSLATGGFESFLINSKIELRRLELLLSQSQMIPRADEESGLLDLWNLAAGSKTTAVDCERLRTTLDEIKSPSDLARLASGLLHRFARSPGTHEARTRQFLNSWTNLSPGSELLRALDIAKRDCEDLGFDGDQHPGLLCKLYRDQCSSRDILVDGSQAVLHMLLLSILQAIQHG